MSETDAEIEELRRDVIEAEEALYSHLDAYGATKHAAYAISNLIDAKVKLAIARRLQEPSPPA